MSFVLPLIDITRYLIQHMTISNTDDNIIPYGSLCSFYCVEKENSFASEMIIECMSSEIICILY